MLKTDARLLLIEDDESLAELIIESLEHEGFSVSHCVTGVEAKSLTLKQEFDLILCDLMLPDIHGFDLVKQLEFSHTCPLIFLTAMSDDETHVAGLELGASDFICKPVEPAILKARVKANLRQFNHKPSQVQLHEYTFIEHNRALLKNSLPVDITNLEFDILWAFIQQPSKPLSREYLFERIVGREYDGLDRAIDLKISRLRKKLNTLDCANIHIETIRRQGYVLTITANE